MSLFLCNSSLCPIQLFTITGDDESTPNGWISFKIKSGNELGLFKLEQGKNFAKVVPARSLKGFYGNYSLVVDVMDGGNPPNVATKEFKICILGKEYAS